MRSLSNDFIKGQSLSSAGVDLIAIKVNDNTFGHINLITSINSTNFSLLTAIGPFNLTKRLKAIGTIVTPFCYFIELLINWSSKTGSSVTEDFSRDASKRKHAS